MSNQYSGRQPDGLQQSGAGSVGAQTPKQSSRDTFTESAASITKQTASEAASTITGQVKDLLDGQLANGADIVGQLGSSALRAAEELDQNAPRLAGLVRGVADRMETFADDMREQSVDELYRSASNFTRRQPALVFGLAALAGFFALRTIKSTPRPYLRAGTPSRPSSSDFHGI